MITVRYQIPPENPIPSRHPDFLDRWVMTVPRVGDMIETPDGRELQVKTVMWHDLELTSALVILK